MSAMYRFLLRIPFYIYCPIYFAALYALLNIKLVMSVRFCLNFGSNSSFNNSVSASLTYTVSVPPEMSLSKCSDHQPDNWPDCTGGFREILPTCSLRLKFPFVIRCCHHYCHQKDI